MLRYGEAAGVYKLLIVDDEERIRKGMETIIDWKAFGFTELYSADNGRNGVLKAKEVRPDLVIADLYMPGVDGIQMIRQLRADGLNCQFIILSGVKDFQYAREAIDLQVATYLLKPIQEDELTRKVASLFGEQSASAAQDAQDMPAASVMARIRSYIEKNCGGPVTLNMIADEFHFSTPYLGRIFKKVTGETFHDYHVAAFACIWTAVIIYMISLKIKTGK